MGMLMFFQLMEKERGYGGAPSNPSFGTSHFCSHSIGENSVDGHTQQQGRLGVHLVSVLLQQQLAATLDFVYPPLFPQPAVHSLQDQAFSVGVLQSHSALSAWVSLGKWLSFFEPQCLQLSKEHPVCLLAWMP